MFHVLTVFVFSAVLGPNGPHFFLETFRPAVDRSIAIFHCALFGQVVYVMSVVSRNVCYTCHSHEETEP